MSKILINCPSCKGGGKILETWYSWPSRVTEVRTNIDCKRCKGYGVIKVEESEITEEV